VASEKRDVLDEVIDGVRRILDEVDKLLNPDKRNKPVPVPIPVRSHPERRYPQDPYRR
jgi:hypothetical protein